MERTVLLKYLTIWLQIWK